MRLPQTSAPLFCAARRTGSRARPVTSVGAGSMPAPRSAARRTVRISAAPATHGGFVGYNYQMGEVVIGIEANYNRTSLNTSSSSSASGSFNDDTGAPSQHHFFYNASVTGTSSARLTDFGTL